MARGPARQLLRTRPRGPRRELPPPRPRGLRGPCHYPRRFASSNRGPRHYPRRFPRPRHYPRRLEARLPPRRRTSSGGGWASSAGATPSRRDMTSALPRSPRCGGRTFSSRCRSAGGARRPPLSPSSPSARPRTWSSHSMPRRGSRCRRRSSETTPSRCRRASWQWLRRGRSAARWGTSRRRSETPFYRTPTWRRTLAPRQRSCGSSSAAPRPIAARPWATRSRHSSGFFAITLTIGSRSSASGTSPVFAASQKA
mmetsp:Transcript_3357/g.8630  ORF Transcript_3357/g.8630 Transcript_3357/m.8630 type:complete len:255 (-) Transcript_3357:1189-1953(-)